MRTFKGLIFLVVLLLGEVSLSAEEKNIERGRATFSLLAPKGWECIADKKQLPAKVEAVYIGNGKHGFTPSINLSMEETSLTLSQYVSLAKEYHESHPDTRTAILGMIDTKSGKAELLQIDRKTQFGPVRFLQCMIILNKKAYVLTATCLESEFAHFSPSFLAAIKSLNIISNNPNEGRS